MASVTNPHPASSAATPAGAPTLPAALMAVAATHPDGLAVVDGDQRLTWSDVAAQVAQIAGAYLERGVEPGDCVAIWAPNTHHWIIKALAVSYAGATLVPLNTRYKGHEVVEILDRTSARLLVLDNGFLGRDQRAELATAAAELHVTLPDLMAIDEAPEVSDVQVQAAHERAAQVSTDDIADILFTSGTTGRPKGVMSAHRQTLAAASVWALTGEVTEQDAYLVINPFFHSFGYKAGIVVGLLTACTLVPQATFDVDASLALIERERISVLPGAPAIFHTLFEAPALASTDLSSLRLAVTGAASVPVALVERMQSELSFDHVLTAFGMTECVVATMCRPGDLDGLVAATCGQPVAGLELMIAGDDAEGEVLLRGPMVMEGYLDDPAATAEAIDTDGWLHTGDVGRLTPEGYLQITDRLKDMYITGGFNVYPAEVEQLLARLPGVVESAVVGVPDARMGEVGRVFVVRRDDTLTADDVIAFAKERLANFKVPRDVVFVEALPRNLSGKVLKNELRDLSA